VSAGNSAWDGAPCPKTSPRNTPCARVRKNGMPNGEFRILGEWPN